VLYDTSAPPILQFFEASDNTVEQRAADVFNAGYGAVYTPPPGRADSGNQSVGYDVYNRFDLGGPGNPTLYGTEAGLKAAIDAVHQFGGNYYIDLVINHNGFSDLSSVDGQGHSFQNSGGYPGFYLVPANGNPTDGDFHRVDDTSGTHGRLAGLIDIAHETDYQVVRSPVPGYANNLPAGTVPAFGRLANVPDDSNRRFYPDQSLPPIVVYDPKTGEQNLHIYPFNLDDPQNGTPVAENAMGYLMRNAQWLVQVMGADGFRIDAAKNVDPWVLNYIDRAVYRSSFRTRLDGSQQPVFSFSEVFDGNKPFIQQFVRKDINPSDPGTVGGNRDVLDFPLYFAMQQNLSGNGLQNDWRNVVNASQDVQDDGLANNGSQGVAFVSNQDVLAPYLNNVAYAYTLMRPGNELVYFNAKEFGPNRTFPKDGRGDALGGLYGDTITNLVDIRDTHGRGNYIQRDLEKEILIYERDNSMLFAGNNRLDGGYDSRTVQTDFAPGTPLIELTGNAGDPVVDPYNDFPRLLVVNANKTVNLRVPRNRNANGAETDKGYVIYGLAGPQGALSVSNVDHVIPGQVPTPATNGTARLSNIDVITGNSFQVELDTDAVNLLGTVRDRPADGDNALIKIDGGLDVNGDGTIDFTQPGTVSYGFEQFGDVHSPGYFNADGHGTYVQTIDATKLSPGLHYIDVRAFRHRDDGGPPVFTDFRQAIYIDRQPPLSAVVSFNPIVPGVNENRRLTVRSTDKLANSVHVLFDLPAALTDAQVIAMVGSGNKATQIDRDLFAKNVGGLTSGNHVATVVTYTLAGAVNVQRFPGLSVSSIYGAGLGDLNVDGQINADDVQLFGQLLASGNTQFNPAADFNGDGAIDNSDLLLFYSRLLAVGADAATLAAYNQLLGPPQGGFTIHAGDPLQLTLNRPGDDSSLSYSWDLENDGGFDDATGATAVLSWDDLAALGIQTPGTYTIRVRVSDGVNVVVFTTLLTILP
jgi:glycosidase